MHAHISTPPSSPLTHPLYQLHRPLQICVPLLPYFESRGETVAVCYTKDLAVSFEEVGEHSVAVREGSEEGEGENDDEGEEGDDGDAEGGGVHVGEANGDESEQVEKQEEEPQAGERARTGCGVGKAARAKKQRTSV